MANATIEPVKVIAPIVNPIAISARLDPWMLPLMPMPYASGATKAAIATQTAARPTRLWNPATSCGNAVIWMRQAI